MLEPGPHCCRTTSGHVVGIDEVGRGCLAGHVTAAAVWFPQMRIPDGVDDSKKVPEKKRDEIAYAIRQSAVVSIGHATVDEIERFGIGKATHMAMERAWYMLPAPRDALVIIDGTERPEKIHARIICMKGADASCPSVAAASLIAKVDRDQAMRVLAGDDDLYGWRKNKGYGTKVHMEALLRHGPGAHHRRGFAPVQALLKGKTS
jgi:ribonuclease HII